VSARKKRLEPTLPQVPVAIPHSWPVKRWPPTVFPGDQAAARHLVRCHKAELTKCGALRRLAGSRDRFIMGAAFHQWLERPQTTLAVDDFRPGGINNSKKGQQS
jgi:hypothetical protein